MGVASESLKNSFVTRQAIPEIDGRELWLQRGHPVIASSRGGSRLCLSLKLIETEQTMEMEEWAERNRQPSPPAPQPQDDATEM